MRIYLNMDNYTKKKLYKILRKNGFVNISRCNKEELYKLFIDYEIVDTERCNNSSIIELTNKDDKLPLCNNENQYDYDDDFIDDSNLVDDYPTFVQYITDSGINNIKNLTYKTCLK